MKITDVIRRAGRNLKQAKGRTILTALAISVGAFTITMALAAGAGGRGYLDKQVSAAGDMQTINVQAKQDEMQASDDKPKKLNDQTDPNTHTNIMKYKELTPSDRTKIASLDGVEKVLPLFSVDMMSVSANGGDEYVGTMSVQYDNTDIELSAGKLGEKNEILPGQTVLPHKFVESLGFNSAEAALGKKIQATFMSATGEPFTRDFTIVAVDKEPTSPLAFYQDQFRISNKDGETIAKEQRPVDEEESYYSFMVTAKQGADVKKVKEEILAAGGYEAMTFAEMRTSIMQGVNIVQYGLMGFGALAVIASIFGVINTMYISVLERTQQIGLMKALGMRSRDVGRLFRFEAAWIGFLGGVIGAGLAIILGLILNPLINGALKLENGTSLLIFEPLPIAIVIVSLILVAVISGIFPSRKAAKLDPIEALRTE